jgi:hypothetical protein
VPGVNEYVNRTKLYKVETFYKEIGSLEGEEFLDSSFGKEFREYIKGLRKERIDAGLPLYDDDFAARYL